MASNHSESTGDCHSPLAVLKLGDDEGGGGSSEYADNYIISRVMPYCTVAKQLIYCFFVCSTIFCASSLFFDSTSPISFTVSSSNFCASGPFDFAIS
jgi:hypothetical protein